MNLRNSWKVVVCLFALIAASGIAGTIMGRRWARGEMARRDNPETWNEAAMRTFDRTVKPTPAQRQKIQSALDSTVEQLKAIRAETIVRSTNVIWRLVDEVERELTPEQKQAFEAMKPRQDELRTLDVLQVGPGKSAP
jgi:membrane-bound lytic murein transglycosylase B